HTGSAKLSIPFVATGCGGSSVQQGLSCAGGVHGLFQHYGAQDKRYSLGLMKMFLNGWQRLWLVLSILYLAAVVPLAIEARPKASDIVNSRVHESIDLAGKYMESSTAGYSYEGSASVIAKHYSDMSDEQILERLHQRFTDKVELSKIDRKYEKQMQELKGEQLAHVGWSVAAWLGPVLFVYALGAAVAWVIKGFRRREANE
ncbi:hypothetical protein, partial [Rhodoferax sp.]|uniref:hypothetical protein n=1 Tax=Rhodoferax sp. TaxID=50421 RepID=UPI0027209869